MAGERKRSWKRTVLWVIGILVALFAVIQAVPYGRNHTNPPAANPFKWPDPQAQTIAVVSCYDCHSNQTNWWWATDIAPFSWLAQADVDGGRARFNFSNYDGQPSVEEFREALGEGMPPFQYTLIHGSARLSDAEKQTLAQGYAAGIAASGGSSSGSSEEPGGQGSTSTLPSPAGADTAAVPVIDHTCVGCHPVELALSYHAGSAAEAQAMLQNMIQRGATLTSDQQRLLVRYFTR